MNVVDEIVRLFESKGQTAYHGEAISQTEHALQSAYQADAEGAPSALVIAALLHDVGHLLSSDGEDIARHGIDGRHEDQGAAWLAQFFPAEVVDPIRLHVAAKRYLCAVDKEYHARLSPASALSLELQGGVMSRGEISEFEKLPQFEAALKLRHWDDRAKVPGWTVPGLEHYRERLAAALAQGVAR